jgi:hypothetical protein
VFVDCLIADAVTLLVQWDEYVLCQYFVPVCFRMSDAPVKLLDRLYHSMPGEPGEQVVVLGQVLADEATLGYEDFTNVQVR